MFFLNEFFFLLPEFYWVFTVIAFLLFSTSLSNKYKVVLIGRLGFIFIYFIFIFFILYLQLPSNEFTLLGYQYVSDPFNFSLKMLFLVFLGVCVYGSLDYFYYERVFFVEYYFLVGLFCVSSFLVMSSNDLFIFYLAIELQSLILYTLATLKRYNVFSTESGLKYFVLGAFSSGLMLFAISLFYGFWGTLNFYDVKFLFLGWLDLKAHYAILLATVFLVSAVLFKFAAAPFHIWVPDVYEGAPSPITMLFAVLPKLAVFGFFIRFIFFYLYEYSFALYSILFFSGIISVLLGTVAALHQLNIKRLYAYSAIVNVGYLITAASYGTIESFSALFNYLIVYLCATISIFLAILLFRDAFSFKKIKYLPEYRVFTTYSGIFAVLLSLVFFSLAGIPPLAGFFIKFFLFKMVFSLDFLLNPVAYIILITSVVSAFYYIQVVRFVFFGGSRVPALFLPLNYGKSLLFVLFTFFILVFFLLQPFFLVGIEYLVRSLTL